MINHGLRQLSSSHAVLLPILSGRMLVIPGVLAAGFVVAGYASHRAYWVRHEFDEQVARIIFGVNWTLFSLTYFFSKDYPLVYAFCLAAALVATYGFVLFGKISIYRLYKHPLKHFRGPFWARLSAWWKVKHIAKAGTHYGLTNQLHEQYGEIVRTGTPILCSDHAVQLTYLGPNNLSINNVEAIQAIYGSHSHCTKPPSYLIGGLVSVQSERDPHRHRVRRAVWDKALGSNGEWASNHITLTDDAQLQMRSSLA